MNITEKAAYLKGLAEGLAIDENSKEGKLFKAVIDLLEDMSLTVADIDDELCELSAKVDEIDEDLSLVEEDLYENDEDDEDDFEDEDDEAFYEVECPECHEKIYLDEDTLTEDKIACPACGKEFDIEIEECDCGCQH